VFAGAAALPAVNLLDVLLLVGIGMAAYGGWRLGLVARGLSWVGLVTGLLVAVWALPRVLRGIDSAGDGWVLAAGLALLVAGAFGGQVVGMLAGTRLRPRLPPWAEPLERAGGAALGVVGAVVFVWVALPALGEARTWPRAQYQDSVVVSVLDDALPDPPAAARRFREIVRRTPVPDLFDGTENGGEQYPDAPPRSPLDAATTARVEESIVRVEARGCARIQEGSGFVAGPGLVVTNAHVVAGDGEKTVVDASGTSHGATVVAFDPARDLAVLAAPDLAAPALPVGTAASGATGAVFGYPGGKDLQVEPYQIFQVVRAKGRDLYDQQDTRRRVFFVATELAAGDSGAALVDAGGNVVGVAFAVDPDRSAVAFALHSDELAAILAGVDPNARTVPTECI
jgi:S1-C subfamily serine protease